MSDEYPSLPRTIHDAMFKQIFSNPRHAAAELRAVLPTRAARNIEWATLEAGHASLVDGDFKQHHGDLIFSARLFDGRGAMVWLLFEHQSTVDAFMPLRVVDLSQVFWRRWREHNPRTRLLPAILPVVVYQGPAPWNAATSLSHLLDVSMDTGRDFEGLGVSCQFVLDDLSEVDDDELSGREMEPYPKLGLATLKYGSDKKLLEHLEHYRAEIGALWTTKHGAKQLTGLLRYTVHVNPYIDREEFIEFLWPIVGQEAKTIVLTLADKIRAEGRDDALREGLLEGHRKLVLKLLARRFGALPPETQERIAKAEMHELEDWAMRLLDARSLADVFDPA